MTTYHTITLTTEQANYLLGLLAHDEVGLGDDIEREIDGALLRHEMDTETPDIFTRLGRDLGCTATHTMTYGGFVETGPLGNQCLEGPAGPDSEFPDTCIWLMEDTNEDGPCARECGNTVAFGERRPYCPWHASALDLPDYEFEARTEAGETWSR